MYVNGLLLKMLKEPLTQELLLQVDEKDRELIGSKSLFKIPQKTRKNVWKEEKSSRHGSPTSNGCPKPTHKGQ